MCAAAETLNSPPPTIALPQINFVNPCPVMSVLPLLDQALAEKLKSTAASSNISPRNFIEILAAAVIVSGYIKLANPNISLQRAQHYFFLAFKFMSRSELASLFASLFHDRVTKVSSFPKLLSVPFLQLGGAGTHYYGDSSMKSLDMYPASITFGRLGRSVAIVDGLGDFQWQRASELRGEWLDMTDLEMLLEERQVHVHLCRQSPVASASVCPQNSVGLQKFIRGQYLSVAASEISKSLIMLTSTRLAPTIYLTRPIPRF